MLHHIPISFFIICSVVIFLKIILIFTTYFILFFKKYRKKKKKIQERCPQTSVNFLFNSHFSSHQQIDPGSTPDDSHWQWMPNLRYRGRDSLAESGHFGSMVKNSLHQLCLLVCIYESRALPSSSAPMISKLTPLRARNLHPLAAPLCQKSTL